MKKYIKPIIIFTVILVARLIPVRPPNVEPILASVLPLGKKFGFFTASVFAFTSIVIYDAFTAGIGSYTWIAAFTYTLLAIMGTLYMKNSPFRRGNYVIASIVGVIFYDVITGVLAGPIFFGQIFSVAFFGQIPFTALHLMGAIIFALVLSPILEKYFKTEEVFVWNFTKKAEVVS